MDANRFYMIAVGDVLRRTEAKRRSLRSLGVSRRLPQGVPFKFMGHPISGPQCVTVSLAIQDDDLNKVMGLGERFAHRANSQFARVYRDLGAIRVEFTLPRQQWRDVKLAQLPHHRQQVTIGQKALGPVARIDWTNPHKAIFGSTQTGKTTVLADMIISLVKVDPEAEETGLLIINPKNDPTFTPFERLPHLVAGIATTYEASANLLRFALAEMERRRRNESTDDRRWVVLVDEVSQLVELKPEVGPIITQLSQMAGGLNINLVIANQAANPSTFGKKGSLAQANIPSRLVFQLPHAQAYLATNLSGQHPEKLGGLGDGLAVSGSRVTRFRAALPQSVDYDNLPRADVAPAQPEPDQVAGDVAIIEPDQWQIEPDHLAYALIVRNSATGIRTQFGGATAQAMATRDYATELKERINYWVAMKREAAA
jgi:hypothetical protein